MTQLLEITCEDIERLDDKQLTELLKKLLHLEASKYNIPASSIHVSLKINVGDGGEDGRIEWEGKPDCTDYIPNRLTMFQCKATEMKLSKCADEVLTKKVRNKPQEVKAQVDKILIKNGCYILFISKETFNQKQLDERINTIKEVFKSQGKDYTNTAQIKIYDANKIRDWVNKYLQTIIYVMGCCGKSLPLGLQTWNKWENDKDNKFFRFEKTEQIDSYIKQLQTTLSQPQGIARIIGLSGLGKTRLAFETFKDNETLSNKVIYIDLNNREQNLLSYVCEWCRAKYEIILIVDNCDLETHQTLEKNIINNNSRLSLLTLDYRHPDEQSNILTIKLEPTNDEVIKTLLNQKYQGLLDADLNRIVGFAQGFPQMAVMLANARLNEEKSIGSLNDDILLEKLLGKHDKISKEIISIASLFENFGIEGNAEDELKFITNNVIYNNSLINTDIFYENIIKFEERGLINKAGRYVQVVPKPLAIRLAADWWKKTRPEHIKKFITNDNIPPRLSEMLCSQVRMLDFLPQAKELVKDLCGVQAPFGQAEVIKSKRGSTLFRFLSEVNPEAALSALERVFLNSSREELLNLTESRQNLVWTLEKLVFHKELFLRATRLLLKLAAAENTSWSNNATGIFLQLFHIHLSGTEASLEERIKIVDEALRSNELEQKRLAIQAMEHILKNDSFTRIVGSEIQGTKPALREWKPTYWQEVFDYFQMALDRLLKIVLHENEDLSTQAKKIIAKSIKTLVWLGRINELDQIIKLIIEKQGNYWLEALEKIKLSIKFGDNLPNEGKQKLREWLELLQPTNKKDKLKLFVSTASWLDYEEYEEEEDNHYHDLGAKKAQALAEECAQDINEWLPHFEILFIGEQQQGYSFGWRLGEVIHDPEPIIKYALNVLANQNIEKKNPIVLGAFLGAINRQHSLLVQSTLDNVAKTNELKIYLVDLTRFSFPNRIDFERITKLVKANEIPIYYLKSFIYGSILKNISVEDVIYLTDNLLEISSIGGWIGFEILYMYQLHQEELWEKTKHQLRKILLHEGTCLIDAQQVTDSLYTMEEIVLKFFKESRDNELAICLTQKIIALVSPNKGSVNYNFEYNVKIIFNQLISNYRDSIWSLISNILLSNSYFSFIALVSDIFNKHENNFFSTIYEQDNDFLLAWCRSNPRAAIILARYIEVSFSQSWSPLALQLIDEFGINESVLNELSANLGTHSWTYSLVPYLEEQKILFEQLTTHRFSEVREWALNMLEYLDKEIQSEKTRDEEHHFGIF